MENFLTIEPTLLALWALVSLSLVILTFFISKQYYVKKLHQQEINTEEFKQALHYKEKQLEDSEQLILSTSQKLQTLETRYHAQELRLSELRTVWTKEQEKYRSLDELFSHYKNDLITDLHNLLNDSINPAQQQFIDTTLQPLKEQIKDFKQKVEDVYDKDSKDRFLLIKQLATLKTLNKQMAHEAINLTKALKGNNKQQGIWGEYVLEQLLDSAGLRLGHEYQTQARYKDDKGNTHIPDIIIYLPNNRQLVIDSKVSLKHYEQYCSAINDKEQLQALKSHCYSLKKHIDNLSNKSYQHLEDINTLDFVFLFIPIEAAFITAINHQPELLFRASTKRIMLTSPTTLLANLTTIKTLWQQQTQSDNAEEIAIRAGQLYDQLAQIIKRFHQLGNELGKVTQAYDGLFNTITKDKENIVGKMQALKALGAKTNENLPDQLIKNQLKEN